jgi:hypothetical protein
MSCFLVFKLKVMRLQSLRFLLIFLLVGIGFTPIQGAIVLHNSSWSVQISPENLAIQVKPKGQKSVLVSRGGCTYQVTELKKM